MIGSYADEVACAILSAVYICLRLQRRHAISDIAPQYIIIVMHGLAVIVINKERRNIRVSQHKNVRVHGQVYPG
jgi:hypothetical protein